MIKFQLKHLMKIQKDAQQISHKFPSK